MSSSLNVPRFQLGLPRTFSTLFAGIALYVGFIDPQVRDSHFSEKSRLTHWSAMFNACKWPMTVLSATAALLGANAYRLTKQPLWIYGSLAAFAIIPYTFLAIMGINRSLAIDLIQSKPGVQPRKGIIQKLTSWVWRHRVRTVLALVSAGLFYAAQGKTSASEVISKV